VAHEAISKPAFEEDVAALTARAAESLGIVIHSKEWPILDVTINHSRPIRFRFYCDDWDDSPPSIEILNPDGSPFSGQIPPGGQFHAGPHPRNQRRPFICMRGSREYHTHPSHTNDNWEQYREQDGMNIIGILMQLRTVWLRNTN
jgi:hypothetical protein